MSTSKAKSPSFELPIAVAEILRHGEEYLVNPFDIVDLTLTVTHALNKTLLDSLLGSKFRCLS